MADDHDHDHDHDHDETVVAEGGGGFGSGMILGIVLATLLIGLAVWYFGFGGFTSGGPNRGGDVNIDVNGPSLSVPENPAPSP